MLVPQLPLYATGYGLRSLFGTTLPPGGTVAAYLRSTGVQQYDDQAMASRLVTTLAAALQRVRSGLGDTIYVLPGHAENVTDDTMLDNMVAGTQIVGAGNINSSSAPKFTWTATGSKWSIDVANCMFSNLVLDMSGANGVVLGVDISANNTSFMANRIITATGASNKVTTGFVVDVSSDDTHFIGNSFEGTATHNSTNIVSVSGACSRFRFRYNIGDASITAANGFVNVSAAALGLLIDHNTLYNTHTASTSCITVGNVAANGMIAYNNVGTLNNGTASAQGIVLGAAALVKAFQNFSSDEPIKSGILAPGVAT